MLLLAVINGAARDLWYKKLIGELSGHQVSTFTLIILFGLYVFFITKKLPPASATQSIYIGMLWLLLTLGFEFGFGLYRGSSWTQLLGDYNILKGRIWVLIPIWVSIAPYVFYKMIK